ncbi:MAG: hypothetical protein II039_08910, partial [Treponema sp.]|nr:hypothetical protein [Treponema sp.]
LLLYLANKMTLCTTTGGRFDRLNYRNLNFLVCTLFFSVENPRSKQNDGRDWSPFSTAAGGMSESEGRKAPKIMAGCLQRRFVDCKVTAARKLRERQNGKKFGQVLCFKFQGKGAFSPG